MKVDKSQLDVAQIFLVYMGLIGDVERVALALDMNPEIIRTLAEQEGWAEKIRRVSMMSKGGEPGDWERAQNRALCFVQAHRYRRILDRVLRSVEAMKDGELIEAFSTTYYGTKDNPLEKPEVKMNAKWFLDLGTSMERAHQMCYSALGDSVKERVERLDSDGNSVPLKDMHTALVSLLNNPNINGREKELLQSEAKDLPVDVTVK